VLILSLVQNHFSGRNASIDVSGLWLRPCLMPVGSETCQIGICRFDGQSG